MVKVVSLESRNILGCSFSAYIKNWHIYPAYMGEFMPWLKISDSLGEMFSQQASPHEVSVVSLESQNIPECLFNTIFRNWHVCPVHVGNS